MGVWKMPLLAHRKISKRVFHAWNSMELDSSWFTDFRPCHFPLFSRLFTRLAMAHTRDFSLGILNYA